MVRKGARGGGFRRLESPPLGVSFRSLVFLFEPGDRSQNSLTMALLRGIMEELARFPVTRLT